jgi:hypothetical protein
MPKLNVFYPSDLFRESRDWDTFADGLAEVVATQMDAVNPATGKVFVNDPVNHIDIVPIPYDPDRARVTAIVLIEIITYAWPHRMHNITERLSAIKDYVSSRVPTQVNKEWRDPCSVTFLAKGEGCWVAG